jgi:cytochrome P450
LPNADTFLPDEHYQKGGKLKAISKQMEYSISTFGYGPHQCPGRSFAVSAAKAVVGSLFAKFDLTPQFKTLKIIESQMGAVGRPVEPAIVAYKLK